MTDERFQQNWFQVRIFSRVPMPQQYPDLLVRVARHRGGTWQFQENLHNENIRLRSVVKSVEHMILNVWRRNDGTSFPIVGFEHFQL